MFITVLLLIFMYIFAIFGVMFFKEGYTKAIISGQPTLRYADSFRLVHQFSLIFFTHNFVRVPMVGIFVRAYKGILLYGQVLCA